MRKLVYYVATTLDGFIAREDGSFSEFPWDEDFGADLLARFPETFPAHLRGGEPERSQNRRFGAVLMGRRTYEVGLREGIASPYPTLDQYVFSRTLESSPDSAVSLVRDDAAGTVAALKRDDGADIWLCGGSELAASLFEAGLVDELMIKLNPVLFGTGLPLLARSVPATPLTLIDRRSYRSGHQLLTYAVPQEVTRDAPR